MNKQCAELNFDNFEKIICNEVDGKSLLVALSGGVDSVVLLHLLNKFRDKHNIKLYAAHYNHMIRAEAQEDEEFSRRLCQKYNVEFFSQKGDVPGYCKERKLSLEQGAREMRYNFLREIKDRRNVDFIVLAHHANDQAETILLNMVRGTGLNGLAGIRFINNDLLRPLLSFEKDDILQYAKKNQLDFCEDITNNDTKYSRNLMREIIKQFEQINDGAVKNIYRMSQLVLEQNQFFEQIIKSKIDELRVEGHRLKLGQLKKESQIVRSNIYCELAKEAGMYNDVFNKNIKALDKLCFEGGVLELKGDFIAIARNDRFYIEKKKINNCAVDDKFCVDFILESEIITPYGIVNSERIYNYTIGEKFPNSVEIPVSKLKGCILRLRIKGDMFKNLGAKGEKKLKDFYIDKKIPIDRRNGPLLVSKDGKILWIAGIALSDYAKIDKNEPAARLSFKAFLS